MRKMPRKAFKSCTVLSVRKAIIFVDERWFRTYITDPPDSMGGCHARKASHDNRNKLPGVLTKILVYFVEIEKRRRIVSRNGVKK